MPTVTRENIGLLIDKITVTVQTEDYLASFEKQLKQFARNANIPGFRKGMVPAGVVKKMHGPALFADEVLRSVEKKLVDYLQGEQLDIFAQPIPSAENSADQLNMNAPSDYSFSFEIGLKPAFGLNLPSVSLPRYKVNVTEEMVNDEIERLQARLGKMSEPEVVDNEENVLNVTFEEEGVENAPKKENSLLVKYFTPAFRSTLMGLKKDSTVTVDLRSAFEEKEREWLIKDLGVDGSDASLDKKYTMTIVKVGLVEKRELNEEFFKEAIPTNVIHTEEEMRHLIREDIQKIRKDFDVKIKDVKAYTQVGTQYTVPIIVQGKDTIIREHTEKIYHFVGRYSGQLVTKGDSLMGEIQLADTLRIAVSRGKRKSWWKVWEKRPLRTNAFLSNPDGTITELKSIITND
jgi:trigger factor